ncbi:MAG: hypothetical protein R3F19_31620, partial [Verrucomicrobiales bacterium]
MTKLHTITIIFFICIAQQLVGTGCDQDSSADASPVKSLSPFPADSPQKLPVARQENESESIDPHNGAWQSEAFAEDAGEQLKALARFLESANGMTKAELGEFATNDISGSIPRLRSANVIFEDPEVKIRRSLESEAQPFSGLADCEKSLGELVATLGQPD